MFNKFMTMGFLLILIILYFPLEVFRMAWEALILHIFLCFFIMLDSML